MFYVTLILGLMMLKILGLTIQELSSSLHYFSAYSPPVELSFALEKCTTLFLSPKVANAELFRLVPTTHYPAMAVLMIRYCLGKG